MLFSPSWCKSSGCLLFISTHKTGSSVVWSPSGHKFCPFHQHYLMTFLVSVFVPSVNPGARIFLYNKFFKVFPPPYLVKHGIQIITYARNFQRQCSVRSSWTPSAIFQLLGMRTSSVYFILKGQCRVSGNACFPQIQHLPSAFSSCSFSVVPLYL